MKIGKKLQISNLILILTVLIVTAVSFRLLSAQYLIREARIQLKSDAASLVQTLEENPLGEGNLRDRVAARKELRVAGRTLETRVIVRNKGGRIIFTNLALDSPEITQLAAGSSGHGYLIERRSLASISPTGGQITLAVKVADVQGLNRLLRRVELFSGLIGGLLALLIGYVLGRSLSRPIRSLAAGIRDFSPKSKSVSVKADSADEIGELALAFKAMVRKLQANDRLQTDFLQNASHELKTPLMAIQGNAEAIKDGIVQGAEAGESLNVIIRECQQLKGIVDELIYLTRLDGVRETYRFEQTGIGELVGEAADSLRPLAASAGIILEIDGDLSALGQFDREKIKRMLVNLIGNGIRYAAAKVTVKVIQRPGRIEIICADDGHGFNPGEERRIFERFYTGENGGTGIGLAIAKAIAEGHGGTIEARNAPQGGALFIVVLDTNN